MKKLYHDMKVFQLNSTEETGIFLGVEAIGALSQPKLRHLEEWGNNLFNPIARGKPPLKQGILREMILLGGPKPPLQLAGTLTSKWRYNNY